MFDETLLWLLNLQRWWEEKAKFSITKVEGQTDWDSLVLCVVKNDLFLMACRDENKREVLARHEIL